jgi:hypothetical protein
VEEVAELAAALEVQSEHPLASAVLAWAAQRLGHARKAAGEALHPFTSAAPPTAWPMAPPYAQQLAKLEQSFRQSLMRACSAPEETRLTL